MANWTQLLSQSGIAVFMLIALGFWFWKQGFPALERWMAKQEERSQQQIKEAQDQVKEARTDARSEREYMRVATTEFLKSLNDVQKSVDARDQHLVRTVQELGKLATSVEKLETRLSAPPVEGSRKHT